MRLAKDHLDVGLFTSRREPMLAFWQREVGLAFEELLPVGGGVRQHRHAMNGSVLKINEARDPFRAGAAERLSRAHGSRAKGSRAATTRRHDPDGNVVTLLGRRGKAVWWDRRWA